MDNNRASPEQLKKSMEMLDALRVKQRAVVDQWRREQALKELERKRRCEHDTNHHVDD